jgi:FtsP/CotA-like multicopper oxidase with cupredoxin domain
MERGQRIGLLVAALVVAVVAFALLSGGDDDDDSTPARTETQQTQSQEPTATVPAPKPEPSVNTIRVVGGEPEGGAPDITVNKGETVRLEVKSPDTAAEVHVHGYDFMKDLEPGGSVRFRFKAGIEGVFEIELEEFHTQIAQLSVEP